MRGALAWSLALVLHCTVVFPATTQAQSAHPATSRNPTTNVKPQRNSVPAYQDPNELRPDGAVGPIELSPVVHDHSGPIGTPQNPVDDVTPPDIDEQQHIRSCLAASPRTSKRILGPRVTIARLSLDGNLRLAARERQELVASLKQRSYLGNPDSATTYILARLRAAWQDRGYLNAQVDDDMKVLGSGPFSYRIALTVHVDAGRQYRLREITFGGNRAIIDIQALRKLFPLRNGDLLSRDAIAKGLENLGNTYLQLGYVNFTSIPNTQIDEQSRTIALRIDVDEGKQFFISGIRIVGLDEHASGNLIEQSLLKPGDIYNQRLAELFLQKHASFLPPNVSPGSRIHRRLNEQAGTVAIAYDFGPCPAE